MNSALLGLPINLLTSQVALVVAGTPIALPARPVYLGVSIITNPPAGSPTFTVLIEQAMESTGPWTNVFTVNAESSVTLTTVLALRFLRANLTVNDDDVEVTVTALCKPAA